ncbi:MAG: hypothetical protein WD533_01670 [Dehalococcoidia bacterium]
MRVSAAHYRKWVTLAAVTLILGIITSAALAQTHTGDGTVTFSIQPAYGVLVSDVALGDVEASDSSGDAAVLTLAGTEGDHLFEIVGPDGTQTNSIAVRATVVDLPTQWGYVAQAGDYAGAGELRLTYTATSGEFNGVNAVDFQGLPAGAYTDNLIDAGTAPLGYYGGTLGVEIGPQGDGQPGEADITLSVSVIPN